MKTFEVQFDQSIEENYQTILDERIAKRNKKKKIVKVETKTALDYTTVPFTYNTEVIVIRNPEAIIGTMFTFEDGTQKFDFFNAWGPERRIGFFASRSTGTKYIKGVVEHWAVYSSSKKKIN